jgi:hypothetical protein
LDDPNALESALDAGERLRERFDPVCVAERFESLYAAVAGRSPQRGA